MECRQNIYLALSLQYSKYCKHECFPILGRSDFKLFPSSQSCNGCLVVSEYGSFPTLFFLIKLLQTWKYAKDKILQKQLTSVDLGMKLPFYTASMDKCAASSSNCLALSSIQVKLFTQPSSRSQVEDLFWCHLYERIPNSIDPTPIKKWSLIHSMIVFYSGFPLPLTICIDSRKVKGDTVRGDSIQLCTSYIPQNVSHSALLPSRNILSLFPKAPE